jgi:hypothetical protein
MGGRAGISSAAIPQLSQRKAENAFVAFFMKVTVIGPNEK